MLGLRASRSTIRVTQVEIDLLVARLKRGIDAQVKAQQLDRARLRSLNAKSNDAFEMISSFIKKTAETQSSVVKKM